MTRLAWIQISPVSCFDPCLHGSIRVDLGSGRRRFENRFAVKTFTACGGSFQS